MEVRTSTQGEKTVAKDEVGLIAGWGWNSKRLVKILVDVWKVWKYKNAPSCGSNYTLM